MRWAFVFAVGIASLSACNDSTEVPRTPLALNDWRGSESELVIATSAPNEAEQMSYTPDVLNDAIGARMDLPVRTQRVAGVGGAIHAMATDQIDLALYGPGAIAGLHDLLGEETLPIAVFRNHEGETGYYSAILVRADSPYYTIDDLKGATLGYVDLNSTSGYIYPRWALRKQGIEPDSFFGTTGMSGGHIQSVVAISTAQYDAVLTLASTGDLDAGLRGGVADRMARRGYLSMDDFRYVWAAGPIPSSGFTLRGGKSQAYIDYLRGVLLAIPYEEPGLVESYSQTRGASLVPVDLSYFSSIIEMRAEEIAGDRP